MFCSVYCALRLGRINTHGCTGWHLRLQTESQSLKRCDQLLLSSSSDAQVMPYWFWSVKKLFESQALSCS